MKVEDKEYLVSFDEVDRRIHFQGSLRLRSAKDYDNIKNLLRGTLTHEFPEITLDFRGLEFLNSSGIGTLGQFVVDARKARKTKLVLHATAKHPWQARSLGTLARIWEEVKLVVDET